MLVTSIVKYLTLASCLAGVISCSAPHPVNGKVAADQHPAGIVDNTGKVRWLPQESTTYPMRSPSEGRAAICVDRQWGFIDTEGRLTIQPQFQFARDFHQGRAAVLVSGGVGHSDGPHYVLMDRECYSIGFAAFHPPPIGTGQCRWGYIDLAGKRIVSVQFSEAGDFHEGLAAGVFRCGAARVFVGYPAAADGEFWNAVKFGWSGFGFIDRSGKFITKPNYTLATDFRGGMALVRK